MTPLPARRPSPSRQRGAATLIVVMILFFVVSLVAAYASRNMIFEQKTSANQYRSTQAFEAAEAGLEWALTMLNGGRLEADCSPASPALATPPAPATPPTKASFRQRYLNVDAATGMYTETMANRSIPANLGLNPTCVYNGAGWTCTCPISTAATPSATPATGYTGPQPAFRVRLLADTGRAGVLRVESVGCTRLSDTCLRFDSTSGGGDGVATVSTLVVLRSGLGTPPTAPITTRGAISRDPPAAFIDVTNVDAATNGITVQTGAALAAAARASLRPTTLPGTPGSLTVIESDATLSGLTANDRMFAAAFGMRRLAYRQQPGLRECVSPCTAADVNALLANHPHRVIWVAGDLALDASIGNSDDPVVLVVGGAINATAGATVVGLVYLGATPTATINAGAAVVLQGALVADNELAVAGAGTLAVNYDPAALARLRTSYGSYVRLPGAWHDWRTAP